MAKLDNVKVGDKLYISCRGDSRIDIVTRVTKTQVIAGKIRFRKKDGWTMASSWNMEFARPATEQDEINIQERKKRMELIYACKHINYERFSSPQLESIISFIKNIKDNGKEM